MELKDETDIDPANLEAAAQILQDSIDTAPIDIHNEPQWCRGCLDFDVVDGACICNKRNMFADLAWRQCESEFTRAGIS